MDFQALQRKLFAIDPSDPREDLRKLQAAASAPKDPSPQIDYLNYVNYSNNKLPDRSIEIMTPNSQRLVGPAINILVTPSGGGAGGFNSMNSMIGFMGYSSLVNIGINAGDIKPKLKLGNDNNAIGFLDVNDDDNLLLGKIGFQKVDKRKENKTDRIFKKIGRFWY
jgi:hypothetical protein